MHICAAADLDAPRAAVWDVLTDLERWAEWNPHVVLAAGDLALGSRLRLRIRTGGPAAPGARTGRTTGFRPCVVELVQGERFAWLGHLGVRGLFDGRHSFVLSDLSGGRTRIVQAETFSGVLVRPLRRTVSGAQGAFDAVHTALAERLAQQAAHPRDARAV